jgi:hypothetical protein
MEWRSERWNQGRGIDLLNGTISPLNQATEFTCILQMPAASVIDVCVVVGTGSAAMYFLSFLLKSNDPRSAEQHSRHRSRRFAAIEA